MALICVRTAGSSLINACIFAPCSANPLGAAHKLTQNAVLPTSGLANAIIKFPGPIPLMLFLSTVKLNCHLLTTFNFSIRLIILGNKVTNLKINHIEIINPGFVSESTKAEYLQSSDVLCAPSLEKESFGIILLEAMASNTAIIASDIQGYNEIITNNFNGLLIEPNNIYQLAQSIKKLYDDKSQKQKLITNANLYIKNLNWDNISDKIINTYKNTLYNKKISYH